MAKSPEAIMLKQITAVENVQDIYLQELQRVYNQLSVKLGQLLESASTTGIADVSLAMADIEKVLIDSGYYELGDKLLSEGYQAAMEASIQTYKNIYGENLQYTDQALQQLESYRVMAFMDYNGFGTSLQQTLAREITDISFGTTTANAAAERLATEIGKLQSQADTIIRTTMSEVHRTSTMLLGNELGIDKYKYYGPDDGLTREFCREILEGDKPIRTMDEWLSLDNGQIGNAATNGGGYNCRHRLVPVSPI